jgi:hypothetical protein
MKKVIAVVLFVISNSVSAQSQIESEHLSQQEVDLGQMKIGYFSVEGTHRAVVVLRGENTPLFRLDCGRGVVLVVDSKKPIGSKPHQLFMGKTQEFYCQATSSGLFGGLVMGDTVDVKLKTEVKQINSPRGRVETVAIKDIIISVITSKYPLDPQLHQRVRVYSKNSNLVGAVDLHSSEYRDLDVTELHP